MARRDRERGNTAAQLCGEVSRVAELVDDLSTVCREHTIPYWQSWAEVLKGWVLAQQGQVTEGMLVMRRGVDAHRKTGAVVGVTYFLTLLAEIYGVAEQGKTGLEAAEEALALAVRTGNRYVEPEIHRVARAHRLLAPLCRWFTEGADTADLEASRRTLAALEVPLSPRHGDGRDPRTVHRTDGRHPGPTPTSGRPAILPD